MISDSNDELENRLHAISMWLDALWQLQMLHRQWQFCPQVTDELRDVFDAIGTAWMRILPIAKKYSDYLP